MFDQITVKTREIGEVQARCSRPDAKTIRWFSGYAEHIRHDQAPPELASYTGGEWIEAEVRREMSGKLLEVVSISRTKPIKSMSAEDAERYFDPLPCTASLPISRHGILADLEDNDQHYSEMAC